MPDASHGKLVRDRRTDGTAAEYKNSFQDEFLLPGILSSSMNPSSVDALDLHAGRKCVGREKALRPQMRGNLTPSKSVIGAIAFSSANISEDGLLCTDGGEGGSVTALRADQEIIRACAHFPETLQQCRAAGNGCREAV
jgi:hypothetical protein